MSTSLDYIEFVCSQIDSVGIVSHKKMFGEYMVYVNAKPVFLVCDSTVYIKMLDCRMTPKQASRIKALKSIIYSTLITPN